MIFKILYQLLFFGLVIAEVCAEAAQVGKSVHQLVRDGLEVVVVGEVVVLLSGNLDSLLSRLIDPTARADVRHLDRPYLLDLNRLAKHLNARKVQPAHIYPV